MYLSIFFFNSDILEKKIILFFHYPKTMFLTFKREKIGILIIQIHEICLFVVQLIVVSEYKSVCNISQKVKL